MQTFPTLSEQARQVLEVLVTNTSIDGSTLLKQASVSRDDLVAAIRELQKYRLIEVGGRITPEEVAFAQFAVLPSAKEYLYTMLR